MPDTLIKFKTGDLSKMDNGATDEVGINNGTVYFATDDTTKNGKIYFDSLEGDRIDMTAYAKESDYATLANNIDGTVSVAHGGTGATDAAAARTNLGIPIAGTTATAVGTTANGGSATTWSKSDHVHNITLATGDNNGQIKIAGTNVSVKGLGSAAYTESSSYASAANEIEHLKDGSAEGSLRATGTAEESSTYTMGEYAIALGSSTKASGASSIAEGSNTIASGTNSHAEGNQSESTSQASHAEGYRTKASSNYAHAEGTNTLAAVGAGHAEGSNTIAYGTLASHAEGSNTMASGMYAHAEGSGVAYSIRLNGDAGATTYTLTTPVEIYPWNMSNSTFGYVCANNAITKAKVTAIAKSGNNVTSITVNETLNAGVAITNTSFIWIMPQARGAQSHTEGLATVALGSSQHVGGQYNIPDSTSLEIIGNGTSNLIRSNARTLDKDGNEVLSGKLTVGIGPINDMDVATKQYVDNASAMNDAIIFKGILNSPSEVPSTHQAGWTYRIGTTGTYVGQICEVGDLLICISDGTEASNDDWNIVQNNLDGALFKGTNTFIDGQVLIADGITGKTKTSGFTIGKSVPSDALFTDTIYIHPSTTATAAAAVKVGNDNLGHVILGDALTANDLNSVAYIEQNLTLEQKNQARTNIGAVGVEDIPTKVSDLTNDTGFITSATMTILSYGSSTWQDFLTAYNANNIVYCRASTNANPASGSQTRLAFMAYVSNATNPTEVEFQYYRSMSSHSASQQGDQVFVYKLTKTNGWTVITREASVKVVVGTGLSSSYRNNILTLTTDIPVATTSASGLMSSTDKSNLDTLVNDYSSALYSAMSAAEMKTGTATSNRVIRADYLKSAFTASDGIFKTGSANGTISVYGTDIAVKGLGSRAYDSTDYLPLTGGTLTGNLIVNNSAASETTTLSANSLIATGIDVESNTSEVGFTFDGANKVIETTPNTAVYINGYLYANSSELTIASATNTVDDNTDVFLNSSLKMSSRSSVGSTPITKDVLYAYNGLDEGIGVLLQGDGTTVVAAGEAGRNLIKENVNNAQAGNGEQLHLASDTAIYFYSNCQTISDRKQISFGADGKLTVPGRIKQADPDALTAFGTYSAANTTVTLTSAYTNYNFLILRFGANDGNNSSIAGISTMLIPTMMITASNEFQHGWYQGTAWQNMKFQFPTTTSLKILTRTGSAAGLRQVLAF